MARPFRQLVPPELRRPLGRRAYDAASAIRRRRDRVREGLGGLPFLAARDVVYDERFYEEMDRGSGELYVRLADALVELWEPRTVVDVGCGTGSVLARLERRGVEVLGIEGSRAAIRLAEPSVPIVRANLERGVPRVGTFDLCLCIEVAEHLRPRSASRLVEGLTALSDVVVFTAARPSQPGTAHLNARPPSYWRSLFAAAGFQSGGRERALAGAIAHVAEPAYVHANLMVLERLDSIFRK